MANGSTMRASAGTFQAQTHTNCRSQQISKRFPGCATRRHHTTSRLTAVVQSSMTDTAVTVTFTPTATSSAARPTLPRSGACAAPMPPSHSHDAILFGGYTEENDAASGSLVRVPTNEAWVFSAASGQWSRVEYTSEAVPATRLVSQCVVQGNKLWLIGGWDSSKSGLEAFLGDIWTLDLETWAWQQQQPVGEPLTGGISRFQAVADSANSRILIHTHRCEDHILALHTDCNPPRLEKVPVNGPAPSSRGLHSVVKVGDALYLFGGAPQKGPMLDDLWKLDLSTMQWQQLQPSGQQPHARCSPAAGAVGDRYILYFGGAYYGETGGLEMLGDVVVYDTHSNAWIQPQAVVGAGGGGGEGNGGALPAARNAAVMVPLAPPQGSAVGGSGGGAQLLLAGGWRAFVETYNDSFLVQLS